MRDLDIADKCHVYIINKKTSFLLEEGCRQAGVHTTD